MLRLSYQISEGKKMNIINVKNLTKKYGDFAAVKDLSFSVAEGDFVGFLGINGAGKSTTINIMSTLLQPSEGNIEICGFDISQSKRIRERIGLVYQNNVLDDLLTVKENLVCRAILHGVPRVKIKEKICELCKVFDLEEILSKKYKILSGGQKRKCEIVAALMHTPKILFLDEPTTGLDPAARIEVWNTINKLRKSTDMTVFLTTHYMEEAEKADEIIIIDKGRKIIQGTPGELKNKYASDYLKLYCEEKNICDIEKVLIKYNFSYSIENFGLKVVLNSVFDAVSLIGNIKEKIISFEVIQGNMDDVFINATREVKIV